MTTPLYGDASGKQRERVDNSVVYNVTSQSYPIVLPPSVIHSSRYLSPVLSRTCPAVMKATLRSARTTFIHYLI